MTEAGYFQSRTISPSGIVIVVALHAGLIAAVAMAKMDVVKKTFEPMESIFIPLPPEPKPVPPPPKPQARPEQPQHESHVDQVKQIVEVTQPNNPPFDPGPRIQDPPQTTEVGKIDIPPPPQPVIERAASAKGDVRALITADDYPSSAVRNEETGSLRAKLMIAANGRVSDCSIVKSSGSQALDSATCKILRSRARFTPALDSNGLPTAGSYVTPTITWQLQS
jgi:protein TonB